MPYLVLLIVAAVIGAATFAAYERNWRRAQRRRAARIARLGLRQ